MQVFYIYFLGVMLNADHDTICGALAEVAFWGCIFEDDSGVVDDDSLMACMVGFLSDSCHDLVCDAFAANTFLSCPSSFNIF